MALLLPFSNITWSGTSLKIHIHSSFSLIYLFSSTFHLLQFVLVSPQPFCYFDSIIPETLLSKVILLLTLEVFTYFHFFFLFILQQWAQIYWEKLRKNSQEQEGFQVGNPRFSVLTWPCLGLLFLFPHRFPFLCHLLISGGHQGSFLCSLHCCDSSLGDGKDLSSLFCPKVFLNSTSNSLLESYPQSSLSPSSCLSHQHTSFSLLHPLVYLTQHHMSSPHLLPSPESVTEP